MLFRSLFEKKPVGLGVEHQATWGYDAATYGFFYGLLQPDRGNFIPFGQTLTTAQEDDAVRKGQALFGLSGAAADLLAFFCLAGGAIWFFNGLLFLGNAAFNNLGFPLRSTLLNWGRATLGTIPPAMLGAALYGPRGVVAGMGIGSLIFGALGILLARRTVDQIGRAHV